MKSLIALSSATVFAFGAAIVTSNAAANDQTTQTEPKVEVVSTNAQGKATQVRIDGRVYDVCMNERQDSCINPRAAGLNWGNVPLDYWPGKPASSMDEQRGG